jgi:hypothetical protein
VTQTADLPSAPRSGLHRAAHVVERSGLAMAGALCGLFVAAPMAKADIALLESICLLFGMILLGGVGFYLGIDRPARASPASRGGRSDARADGGAEPAELLGAAGTFLAATAALVSVDVLIFDDVLPKIWIIVIGGWWLLGIILQIVAGVTARICGAGHRPQ